MLGRCAQQTPADVAAGGAERIRSLTDRVWFKCKVSNLRGAVTKIDPSETGVSALLESGDDDWLAEPGGAMGIEPRTGQIIYSAMIPADTQAAILDEYSSAN